MRSLIVRHSITVRVCGSLRDCYTCLIRKVCVKSKTWFFHDCYG
jgi:hypothetical protein